MYGDMWFTPAEGPMAVYGPLHIGRHARLTQFYFHAYQLEGGTRRVTPKGELIPVEVEFPRLMLKSWEDWRTFLRETPGEIKGAVIERFETRVYSVADFEKLVRKYGPGKYRQGEHIADYARLSNIYDQRQKDGLPLEFYKWWKDAEGYAVCTADCFV